MCESLLSDVRRSPGEARSGPGQRELQHTRVPLGSHAPDQAPIDESGHYRGHAALVGVGKSREVVEGDCRGLGELLKHEELGAGESETALRHARGFAQGLHKAAQCIEHPPSVVILRYIGPHMLALCDVLEPIYLTYR